MSDDEWYESDDDDTFDRLLGILDDADKTPVERLQEQVQEHKDAVKRAKKQLQAAKAEFERQQKLLNSKQRELAAANAEFERQEKLLNSKQRELAAAQQAAANKPKSSIEQYIAALRKSRQGMTFKEWQQDASKNKERHSLYNMYTQLIKDKLADPMKMPPFGKYPGEK